MKHIELFKSGFDSTINEKVQPENWPYIGRDMVYKVSSTGTFIKHPDMTSWTTGSNGIPSGWEVVDTVI